MRFIGFLSVLTGSILIAGCGGDGKPTSTIAAAEDSVLKRPVDLSKYPAETADPTTSTHRAFPDAPIDAISPESIDVLPAWVQRQLHSLGCLIPQMVGEEGTTNFLFGEFRAKGDSIWAVACVAHGQGGTLVFKKDTLAAPDSLDWTSIEVEAGRYARDSAVSGWTWTRQISAVGPDNARNWCRAGAREPIHSGLVDFSYQTLVGAHYFEEGHWHGCPNWPDGD